MLGFKPQSQRPSMRIPKIEILVSIVAIVGSVLIYQLKPLTASQFFVFLFNILGTILLAGSISFHIPSIGQGFLKKLRWALLQFPNYYSPPSFNPIKFYLGLLFLVVSSVINVISI